MTQPHDPSWAGDITSDYFMFTRHGRWHIHDGDTGARLGIIALCDPSILTDNESGEEK